MTPAARRAAREDGAFKMDIRVLDNNEKEQTLSLLLKGTSLQFANLLRRYIIERVNTMAIDEIEFKDNSSIMYDEVLAHRLGLIPLTTDLKSYYPISECKCNGEGCNRCTVKLTLTASGPATVHASQIKSKDPKVKPVHADMPIVKLLKDQTVELVATAVLGSGRSHTKFSPGLAYYRLKPEITITKQLKNAESFVKNQPVPIFEMKGKNVVVNPDKVMDAHLLEDYVVEAEPADAIQITNSDEILFNVESWGQLDCKEMIIEALNQYLKDLETFEGLIKK